MLTMLYSGRGWKAAELRLKSWDDLHKLWYVLLKERNMLMTQRQMLNAHNLRFPNPERLPKVQLRPYLILNLYFGALKFNSLVMYICSFQDSI